jgi:hypothetical protein
MEITCDLTPRSRVDHYRLVGEKYCFNLQDRRGEYVGSILLCISGNDLPDYMS